MEFPVFGLATSVGLAAVDGVVSSSDTNAGRTSVQHQRTTWVQGGAALLGVVGEFAWPHLVEINDSLVTTAVALFTRNVAFRMAQGSASTVVGQGYRAYVRPQVQQPQAVAAPLARPATPNWQSTSVASPIGARF